jgi:hypothetical protein
LGEHRKRIGSFCWDGKAGASTSEKIKKTTESTEDTEKNLKLIRLFSVLSVFSVVQYRFFHGEGAGEARQREDEKNS